MKILVQDVLTSIKMTAVIAGLACVAYPVVVLVLAQGLFPGKANGSLVYHNGSAVGSALLGQPFTEARYFHPRPSAAGTGYDGKASGGSNLGPTSKVLIDQVRERVRNYRDENRLADDVRIPADAVTASGSGLDPDISVQNALLQVPRVAEARGWSVETTKGLIERHIEGRSLDVLGEPRLNVLQLNLALDRRDETDRSQ